MSESKNMHGRKEGHFKNAQHKSCRRPRTRLHVELDADLSAKLAAVLQAENLTQREWMHAAVTASLGKRGFGAAGRENGNYFCAPRYMRLTGFTLSR